MLFLNIQSKAQNKIKSLSYFDQSKVPNYKFFLYEQNNPVRICSIPHKTSSLLDWARHTVLKSHPPQETPGDAGC